MKMSDFDEDDQAQIVSILREMSDPSEISFTKLKILLDDIQFLVWKQENILLFDHIVNNPHEYDFHPDRSFNFAKRLREKHFIALQFSLKIHKHIMKHQNSKI